jgi:cysteine desulfurase / selenocysteine lyase
VVQLREDAMCFCRGNPAHLSIYILRRGLEYLQKREVEQIQSHVQSLTSELLLRLQDEGIKASTPSERERNGANVNVDCEGASVIVERMRKAGIYA